MRWVFVFGWFQPVDHRRLAGSVRLPHQLLDFATLIADDLPMVVVDEHVMVAAKKDAIGQICAAAVAVPFVDVVGFAPQWWPITVGEAATPIPDG